MLKGGQAGYQLEQRTDECFRRIQGEVAGRLTRDNSVKEGNTEELEWIIELRTRKDHPGQEPTRRTKEVSITKLISLELHQSCGFSLLPF